MDMGNDEPLLTAGDTDSRDTPATLWNNQLSWKTAVAFIAAYAALLAAGYSLQINTASPASLWPSGGLLFATLMLLRKRDWVWVILLAIPVDVAVNWLTPPGPFIGLRSATLYAFSNALDGLFGALLARRWISALSSPRQAAALYLAGAIGGMFSTTISAVIFLSLHPDVNPLLAWLRWWAGNVLGIVIVAPIMITWTTHWRRPDLSRAKSPRLELATLNGLLLVITAIIFSMVPARSTFDLGLQFLVLPLLILIALQCPSRWTMVSASVMTVMAVALTNRGLGPFSRVVQPFSGVFALQIFLILTVATTFILSVALEENRGLLVALTFSRGRHRREAQLLREEMRRNRIVEQQRADAERENRQLAALLRNTPEFIGVASLDGRAVFINEFGRKLIGIGQNDSLDGLLISDTVHPTELNRLAEEVLPHIMADGHWSGELAFRRLGDNTPIPMLTLGIRIDDSEGHPIQLATVSRDLTEAKQAEAELRELANAFLDETDRQQSQLGREIHDGLGQELTGLSLLAGAAVAQAERGKPVSTAALAEIVAVVRQATVTTRAISRGLSPLTEHAGELLQSLRQLAERAGASPPPQVRFHERGQEPICISQDARNHLYRITQEALANALRHAHATEIDVYLVVERNLVSVKVADNGVGIGDGPLAEGLGMRTMRYRARNIGGTFTVGRGVLGGTIIQCELKNQLGVGLVSKNAG